MSRNLCQSSCYFCQCGNIVLEETPRPITKADAGYYFDEFEGLIVAHAHCFQCEAKYLAWLDGSKRKSASKGWGWDWPRRREDGGPGDLSFRSTFNDEPGEEDMPKWKIVMVATREPWT